MLYAPWNSRNSIELRLAAQGHELEPGDTVSFQSYGTQYNGIVRSLRNNGDWSVSLTVQIVGQNFPIEVETQEPVRPPNEVPTASGLISVVMDAPAIYPAEANVSSDRLFLRAGFAAYSGGVWAGGQLEASDTASTGDMTLRVSTSIESQVATVVIPPAGNVEPYMTDYDSKIVVSNASINTDELEDATYDAVLTDPYLNLIAIGSGSYWEYVQWMNHTIDGNQITFTGLHRGRFGTEYYMDSTKSGDLCVVMDASLQLTPYPRQMLLDDTSYLYRVRAPNAPVWRSRLSLLPLQGNFRKPLSPARVQALRGDDGWITFTWERRERFHAGLRDGTADIPLTEARELYALDIFSPSRKTVARAIEGLTERAYRYGPNMQARDGHSASTSLYVRVYQINETHVGRGFPGGGLIEIKDANHE